jgi:hypothetical protein
MTKIVPTAKKVTVTNILWDTDGNKSVAKKLPKEIEVEIPATIKTDEEADAYVSDAITVMTGFCHEGFCCTPELTTLY